MGMVCMCSSSKRVEPWSGDGKWDGFWSIVSSRSSGGGFTIGGGREVGGGGG